MTELVDEIRELLRGIIRQHDGSGSSAGGVFVVAVDDYSRPIGFVRAVVMGSRALAEDNSKSFRRRGGRVEVVLTNIELAHESLVQAQCVNGAIR